MLHNEYEEKYMYVYASIIMNSLKLPPFKVASSAGNSDDGRDGIKRPLSE